MEAASKLPLEACRAAGQGLGFKGQIMQSPGFPPFGTLLTAGPALLLVMTFCAARAIASILERIYHAVRFASGDCVVGVAASFLATAGV